MSSWNSQSQAPPPIPKGVIPADIAQIVSMKQKGPSGLAYTWRLWRHCCCRYGWYPLIIAPLVTAGCLLSLYSAAGCDFVRVDIGFTPTNEAWNQSTGEFGLFLYQSDEPDAATYQEAFVEGCRFYESSFSDFFIDDDRTWKVATIMAYISAVASLLATVTAWLFVISPLPASFFWPGVLLPALTAAFLAEGSKFLLFDTSMCRNAVWFPIGTDSLPTTADECRLGTTSYYCIAAGTTFFISLLLVCLKAPQKRILDSEFGTRTEFEHGESLESAGNFAHQNDSFGDRDLYSEDPDYDMSRTSSMPDDRSDLQFSSGSRQMSRGSRDYRFDPENPRDCTDSLSGRFSEDYRNRDDLVAERLMKTLDGESDRIASRIEEGSDDSSNDDRYNPKKPSTDGGDSEQSVSESRLHTAERLRLNSAAESRDLIERFVNEVNHSFAKDIKSVVQEDNAEEKKDDDERNSMLQQRAISESRSMTQESLLCITSSGGPPAARSY